MLVQNVCRRVWGRYQAGKASYFCCNSFLPACETYIIANVVFEVFVPQAEEACITVNHKSLLFPVLGITLQGFKYTECSLEFLRMPLSVLVFQCGRTFPGILKLMIHIDCPILKINISVLLVRQNSKLRSPVPKQNDKLATL